MYSIKWLALVCVVGTSINLCSLGVLGKLIQSNARFGLTDRLEVHLNHIRMPAGKGRVETKGRSLNVMSDIKKSIVVEEGRSQMSGLCTY